MADAAAVVVIGAGIQGLSAAYHLAAAGVRPVCVLEKDHIGSGSSGRSASMLMLQRETRPKIALSLYSYARYLEFAAEIGTDPRFRKIGFLSVVPDSRRVRHLEMAALRTAMGVHTDILTPVDIRALVPIVNTQDITLGVFGPDDGVIDARAIMLGYSDAAKRLGVTILEGERALGIDSSRCRVTAVQTSSRRIPTAAVVNAAGADAPEVGSWVSVTIPIMNRLRHIFLTEPDTLVPDDSPMVEDAEAEWYYRKEGAGVLMGMGKVEAAKPSTEPDRTFLAAVRDFARHRVPELARLEITGGWSGIRSLTADLSPIIGPVEEVEGFINCCGWGGEGVMHAPAGGKMVADILSGNASPSFEVSQFSLDRFREPRRT
jgi:sarcosine oxidase subunit beta